MLAPFSISGISKYRNYIILTIHYVYQNYTNSVKSLGIYSVNKSLGREIKVIFINMLKTLSMQILDLYINNVILETVGVSLIL